MLPAAVADAAEPAGESIPHAGAELDEPAADAAVRFEGSLPGSEEPAIAADGAGAEEYDAPVDNWPPAGAAAAAARAAAPVGPGFERALAAVTPAFLMVWMATTSAREGGVMTARRGDLSRHVWA